MWFIFRLAEEEILREAHRAIARSEVLGIEGFNKNRLPSTNKRFLTNTILNNMKSNKFKEAQQKKKTRFKQSEYMQTSKKKKNDFELGNHKMQNRSSIASKTKIKKVLDESKSDLTTERRKHSNDDIKSNHGKKRRSNSRPTNYD